MEQVSIIVPFYNSMPYLEQCIASICQQTYPHFELILIDDGSKDQSLVCAQKWADQDQRIKIFRQKNAGVSSARNLGLDNSRGKYILFIDSDDYIEEHSLQYLMNLAKSLTEKDLINFSYWVENSSEQIVSKETLQENHLIPLEELARKFWTYYKQGVTNSPCNKLYHASLIRQYHLRFPENMKMGEDLIFNLNYFQHIDHLFLSSEKLYHYRMHDHQATKQANQTIIDDMLIFLPAIELFINQQAGSVYLPTYHQHGHQLLRHLLTAGESYFNAVDSSGSVVDFVKILQLFDSIIDMKHLQAQNTFESLVKSLYSRRRFNSLAILLKSKAYLRRLIKF